MENLLCQGCGEPLIDRHKHQRYHDDRCRQQAYRQRKQTGTPGARSPAGNPLVVLAGVDTLYLNGYYADPETFRRLDHPLDDDLQARFTDLQQQAKTSKQDVETPWSLENQPLYMLSHGSGKQWRWILHNDWLNVQIGTGDYRGVIAHIRVSSEYLWRVNALYLVLALVHGLMNRLFTHEMVLVPSAIDLCADVAHWPMESIDHRAVIARARKHRPMFTDESLYVSGEETWNGRKLGTLYLGMRGSPVHGKLYDKLKEIKDGGNRKAWFLPIYRRNGWDGEAPVTRLEVSFKREALHDLDIETDTDLVRNLKGLWAYAVGSETVKPWMRYTVPTADHIQTRWPMHPMWPIVQHAFDTLSEHPARELIRLKKQEINLETATASIAGYLTSRTAWLCDKNAVPVESMALETAVADLLEDVEKLLQHKGVSFQQLLEVKQHRYYLREARTREVSKKRAKSHFNDVSEAIEERIEP